MSGGVVDTGSRHEQMRRACNEFHRRNPEVWTFFVQYTLDRIARGFKHYSADEVMHRVRWETAIGDQHGFKINDHHVTFYARRFMKEHPEHEGFFRLRTQTSKQRTASS